VEIDVKVRLSTATRSRRWRRRRPARILLVTITAIIGLALTGATPASAATAGGHLWGGGGDFQGVMTGPIAAGSTPSIATPSSGGDFQVVWQGVNGHVWTTGSGPTDLGVAMADGTNPSLAELPNAGYVVAFQHAGDGNLWTTSTIDGTRQNAGQMAPGTSPSVVTVNTADVFQMVWQGVNNHLWTSAAHPTDTGMAMYPGTSPSLTELGGTHEEVAYEGANGDLWIYGSNNPGDTGQQMALGTSPAIMNYSTGFLIAFHGPDGNLSSYEIPSENVIPRGVRHWGWPMVPGTSPSVADADPFALITFQMADTAIAPFGEVMTFLPFDAAGQVELINDGAAAASNTGTSIALLRNGRYEVAFQATT
jgi:hypothetical protein